MTKEEIVNKIEDMLLYSTPITEEVVKSMVEKMGGEAWRVEGSDKTTAILYLIALSMKDDK